MRSAAVLVLLVALSAACSGGDDGVEPLASSSCSRLVYEGEGEPAIIVSDFPLRGFAATFTRRMVEAIEFVVRQRGFRAGGVRVGYQSCNDTVGDEPYDPPLCRRNARAYVAAQDVVAVVGPWNSGCAEVQIPIVSRLGAGPLAMISPSNTYHGLTREGSEALYPDGVRSYLRVVTHDHAQGIAAAQLAKREGARSVAVVHQDFSDAYVRALAASFTAGARSLGLETNSFEWPLRSATRISRQPSRRNVRTWSISPDFPT
jgi:branched-chain amino acid transport system substrate-binding protein